ncbi:phosphonate ABC transporter ATP-binding protein [Dongia sedimenti]|uniref:Phosphonate ABC transporter ATP-binding protein n=1 Tax=Dongia sedimenti TaxID=3064282 RepID=A0ABU0YTQ8_9PROT|nr:phosphonate ABC transporter ATP-binding protein [Rhodospirillaceae bacterium R-7]
MTHWAVEVRNLSKTFGGGRKALDGVSITVAAGEMVALIGASGSGKSTLLRHLSGLVAGDRRAGAGAIKIGGAAVQANGRLSADVRRIRGDVGFVFQQFNLVNRLTVITNVLIGTLGRLPLWRTLLFRFPETERRRAIAALQRVGIADWAFQRAATLSGGQQQRAAIARAMVQGAKLVLADEPIASLDPEAARRVMESLAELNRGDGVTVIVSLHQVQFAMRYCPRTIALRSGQVVFDGPSAALTPQKLAELYGAEAEELLLGEAPTPAKTSPRGTIGFPRPVEALAIAAAG